MQSGATKLLLNKVSILKKTTDATNSLYAGMSSLMYPKVFDDYMSRQQKKAGIIFRYLPTPVYLHGMVPNQTIAFKCPKSSIIRSDVSGNIVDFSIQLLRVGPIKKGFRELTFVANGNTYAINVKDRTSSNVFEGAMADPSKAEQIGSPMPGAIEKMLVQEGQVVLSGAVLCTISAMKMEVKVTAPFDCTVLSVTLPAGEKVVEGALLFNLKRK